MKFRKRPVVVEAFRYGIDPMPDWFCDMIVADNVVTHDTHCYINPLSESSARADAGDYIIQGIRGEVYPCRPHIFEEAYELADDTFSELGTIFSRHRSDPELRVGTGPDDLVREGGILTNGEVNALLYAAGGME